MADIPVFFLHGLAYASLLFLLSSGLTLVFGMMNVLNFAHAAFYMLGAYFSYTVLTVTGNFWLSILVCPEDRGPLLLIGDDELLYNPRLRRGYRIEDDIPVLLVDEAVEVTDEAEHQRLLSRAKS